MRREVAAYDKTLDIFYLSGWIEKDGKIVYDKKTSKKRTSMTERG